MNRRTFIKATVASGVLMGFSTGAFWLNDDSNSDELIITAALNKLELLGSTAVSNGVWNPTQIFTHCAQSVEYSMSAFPQHNSKIFKSTVGPLALSVFVSKGEMSHGLSEPIPGAPPLPAAQNRSIALARLKNSMIKFSQYEGSLAPHFAYGMLTKREYEIAHVMHLYNHLNEISHA
ncbi:MAG: DUF1569 domain-containing protein [Pseudomonadales bacterium]|nr:DUF1569 domain-containing protein [Pseudomonadales bacterium]